MPLLRSTTRANKLPDRAAVVNYKQRFRGFRGQGFRGQPLTIDIARVHAFNFRLKASFPLAAASIRLTT